MTKFTMKSVILRSLLLVAALAMVLLLQGCKVPFKNKIIMIFEDGTRYFKKRASQNVQDCRNWFGFAQSAVDKYKVKYHRFTNSEQEEVSGSAGHLGTEVQKCFESHDAKVDATINSWFKEFKVDLGDVALEGTDKPNCQADPPTLEVKPASQTFPQVRVTLEGQFKDQKGDITAVLGNDQYTVKLANGNHNFARADLCYQIVKPPPMPTTSSGVQTAITTPPETAMRNVYADQPDNGGAQHSTIALEIGEPMLAHVEKHDSSTIEVEELKDHFKDHQLKNAHSRANGIDNDWMDDDMVATMDHHDSHGHHSHHSHHKAQQELF